MCKGEILWNIQQFFMIWIKGLATVSYTHLERINYGYRKVIIMMLVSGLFSIVVIGILFANTMHYVQNVTVVDREVKICRINVNSSARNIREMALNNDTSSYDDYEQTVERLLAEVNSRQ